MAGCNAAEDAIWLTVGDANVRLQAGSVDMQLGKPRTSEEYTNNTSKLNSPLLLQKRYRWCFRFSSDSHGSLHTVKSVVCAGFKK